MDSVGCDYAIEQQCHKMNAPYRMYLLDNCLSVSRYDFQNGELFEFLLVDCQAVKAPFRFDHAKRMTFSLRIFSFRRRPINAEFFSNVVFQRAQTIRSIFTRNNEKLNVNYRGMKFSKCVFPYKIPR